MVRVRVRVRFWEKVRFWETVRVWCGCGRGCGYGAGKIFCALRTVRFRYKFERKSKFSYLWLSWIGKKDVTFKISNSVHTNNNCQFYSRCVWRHSYPSFKCDKNCDITVTSRKKCRSCRWSKCLAAGNFMQSWLVKGFFWNNWLTLSNTINLF